MKEEKKDFYEVKENTAVQPALGTGKKRAARLFDLAEPQRYYGRGVSKACVSFIFCLAQYQRSH